MRPTMDAQIGWQDYVAIVLRRRMFFMVPALIIFFGSLIVGLFMPKIYRAETVILVQEPDIMNPLIQGLAISTSVGQRLGTIREEILGWTSLGRLVHELKLDKDIKSPVAYEKLIKQLQEDIHVRMRGQDLIRITYENQDPKLAQQLVNTVSAIFLERNVTAQTTESETAIAFIEREMDVYKKKLETSEQALREFKEIFVTQMPVAVELNNQIIDLEVALSQLLIENTEEHPVVMETRRRITDLKIKRNDELKRFIANAIARGQDAQVYDGLMAMMGQTKNQPVDANAAQSAGVDPKTAQMAQEAYAAWVDKLDSTKQSAQPVTQQIQVITNPQSGSSPMDVMSGGSPSSPVSMSLAPWQEQELSRLNRDYDVNAQTYQNLQKRLEQANITQRLGESDEGLKFKILEPARLPLRPVKPNMWKIGFFGLLLGVFLGASVAFVAEYLDQSFQTAEEVQRTLELPVLGSISTILTEEDVAKRRQEVKTWLSPGGWRNRISGVFKPVTKRVDGLLVKWGL